MDLYLRLIQLVMVGFGLWQLGNVGLNARRSFQAAHWPTAPGRISDATADYLGPDSSDLPTGHAVTIRYEYAVAGQPYTSERIAFFEGGPFTRLLGQRERDELVGRYQPGQGVSVYYDPAAPDQAVLNPDLRPEKVILHALGALFFLALGTKGIVW